MRLRVIGCSGSFAGPTSPASCYLVEHDAQDGTHRLVLDLGNGALGPLQTFCDPTDVDAYVISHLHADHVLDMCGLYVMHTYDPYVRHEQPITVYGPAGLPERLQAAYGMEGGDDLSGTYDHHALSDGLRATIGPFELTWHRVEHPVEAYGVRVTAGGKAIAYTGDTDDSPALDALLADADLVLADSAFTEERDETRGVHLTGARAAQAAARAGGVQQLVLTHLVPWTDPQVSLAEARAAWSGAVELAAPGQLWEL